MTIKEKNAYLAGMIDGEGTITITSHTQYNRKTYQFKPFIYVTNSNKDVMEFITKEFGGKYIMIGSGHSCYRWSVMSMKNISGIIEKVFPYLIIKKQQAILMKKYLNSRNKALLKDKNAPYSSIDSHCHYEIRNLNKRMKKVLI